MKVTIIGASTPGLFTAYLLAKEGIEIKVYEKNSEIGPPRRRLIVTQRLADVLGFLPENAVLNEINRIKVFSISNSTCIELKEPDLVVERVKLIKHLASLAEKAGAQIITSHEFQRLETAPPKQKDRVTYCIKNLKTNKTSRETTDVLVGADGYSSHVRASLKKKSPNGTANLIQARIPLPSFIEKDTTCTWFDSSLTPYFIWLIPESEHIGVAGTIGENPSEAHTALLAFLNRYELNPLEFQSAPTPLHHFRYKGNLQSPCRNIFVVGDAAGQVKATTVGGLVTGLRGAVSLSNALLNGRHYQRELHCLKRELDIHLMARYILNTFRDNDYDTLLSLVNGKPSPLLSIWSRDEFSKSIWSLIFSEPRFLSLCIKAWFRNSLGKNHNLEKIDQQHVS